MHMLEGALESIVRSKVPGFVQWEILVVDNNSTDGTCEVVEKYALLHPGRVRYFREARQGKSFALNTGIRESRGEILAFTDDDVLVEEEWLWNLTACLQSSEWAGTGGRIIPTWDQPIPRWLSTSNVLIRGALVALDLGSEPVAMAQAPIGANMAYRRDVFEKHGLFRTDLGRTGGNLMACEDTEFGQRLLRRGERIRFEPSAVVYHPVPQNRMNKRYFLAWSYGHGQSELISSETHRRTNWFLAGVPLYLIRRLGRWCVEWVISIKPSQRFVCMMNVSNIAGSVVGSYRLRHGASPNSSAQGVLGRISERDELRTSEEQAKPMSISVIVCTFNRSLLLERAIESIAQSRVPDPVEWEIVVVDNNSTDSTREAVKECAKRHQVKIRYLFEPKQGLSFARNSAIQSCRSVALAFTDDDVLVEPEWLWNLAACLQSGEWAGSSGRIIPTWDRPVPRWLSTSDVLSRGALVALDLGSEPVAMAQAPIGANMAYRREVFEKHGLFRIDLGRIGGNLMACEDTEFGERLLLCGERLRYEPAAVVYHPVPDDRLRKGYLLAWALARGRSDILMSGVPPETKWFILGVPLYLFRRLARWSVEWLLTLNPRSRFSCRMKVWGIAGAIQACHQLSRVPSQKSEGVEPPSISRTLSITGQPRAIPTEQDR
jgi:glycosyltransferase involved in cell wall biosynthesis